MRGENSRQNKTVGIMSLSSAASKVLPILAAALLLLFTVSCGQDEPGRAQESESEQAAKAEHSDELLRIVYPEWSSETASAHLFQAVLQERMGYRVRLIPVPVEEMWSRVASGEADILTGAWLPTTHRDYLEEYGGSLVDIGPNLTGARIGLVVPTVTPSRQTDEAGETGRPLVTITSIPELEEAAGRFDGRIIGIESGAGVVGRTREALESYRLEREYRLIGTDETGMMERVADAVYNGEWVVFTGWKPHRAFELYNLRFLDDPKGVFGGEESIHTMVREGFESDFPEAFRVLSRISYEPEDLERLMRWIHNDEKGDPYAQALRWIDVHEQEVDSWVEAGDKIDGG